MAGHDGAGGHTAAPEDARTPEERKRDWLAAHPGDVIGMTYRMRDPYWVAARGGKPFAEYSDLGMLMDCLESRDGG